MTVPIYSMADTWNAGATTFQSILMNVTNGSAGNPVGAAASELISLQTNATERFGVRCPHFSLGTDATPFLNLSDIWNTSATITGIKYNVTNTASNAASLLVDFQVGGVSKGKLDISGAFTANSLNANTAFSAGFGAGVGGCVVVNTGAFQWSSNASSLGTPDVSLFRDAASILALRSSTSAQTFRVYNTFTDASNYERLAHLWASNVAILDVQKAGTGSQRAASFRIGGTEIVGLTAAGVLSLTANNSTGAGSALLGTNSPATTLTSPYTWITVISNDGSTCYLPVWK